MVSWKYFNKQNIERSFKMKNWVKPLIMQLLRKINWDRIINLTIDNLFYNSKLKYNQQLNIQMGN